jgi:hypothetical protein
MQEEEAEEGKDKRQTDDSTAAMRLKLSHRHLRLRHGPTQSSQQQVRCLYFSFSFVQLLGHRIHHAYGPRSHPTGFACCNQLPHVPSSLLEICLLSSILGDSRSGPLLLPLLSVTECSIHFGRVVCALQKNKQSLAGRDWYIRRLHCTTDLLSSRCGLP